MANIKQNGSSVFSPVIAKYNGKKISVKQSSKVNNKTTGNNPTSPGQSED